MYRTFLLANSHLLFRQKKTLFINYEIHGTALGLAMRLFLLMRIDAHQMRINRINSKKNHLFLTKIL